MAGAREGAGAGWRTTARRETEWVWPAGVPFTPRRAWPDVARLVLRSWGPALVGVACAALAGVVPWGAAATVPVCALLVAVEETAHLAVAARLAPDPEVFPDFLAYCEKDVNSVNSFEVILGKNNFKILALKFKKLFYQFMLACNKFIKLLFGDSQILANIIYGDRPDAVLIKEFSHPFQYVFQCVIH